MTITISPTPGMTTGPGVDPAMSDMHGLQTLADLMSLAEAIADLSGRARQQLAGRPTVTAHIGQAEEYLTQLHRALNHAQGTLRYNARLSVA